MHLNPEQLEAAQQSDVPVLVLAGPGTGKTTALVGRYVHLLNSGVDAKSILCCTFAKKAADELSKRIQLESGISTRGLPIGTFHSLALRLLKSDGYRIGLEPPSQVLMEKDRLKTIFDIKKSVNASEIYKDLDKESSRPSNILKYIDEVREQLLDPEDASVEASEGGNLFAL